MLQAESLAQAESRALTRAGAEEGLQKLNDAFPGGQGATGLLDNAKESPRPARWEEQGSVPPFLCEGEQGKVEMSQWF